MKHCIALTRAGRRCRNTAPLGAYCPKHVHPVTIRIVVKMYCPNCSMPRRRIHFDGEVWQCQHCRSWWHAHTVADPVHASLFHQGGPAGYDPETGFEAQDLPRAVEG